MRRCCPLACSALVWLIIAVFLTTYLKSFPNMYSGRSTRLASTIAGKIKADEFWLNGNKRQWYAIDPTNLGKSPSKNDRLEMRRIVESFVEMYEDDSTKEFISDSVEQSDSVLTQMWHSLAKSVLSFFYTQTDINGYLRRGSMFVFSEEQFKYMLDKAGFKSSPEALGIRLGDTLMDLGAGDGGPTQQLSPFFGETHVTETSWAMRDILNKKGFKVLEVETWTESRPEFYDMISCLNLLDRCEKPATLLNEMRGALKPGGHLLVALVLPFRPYVEFSSVDSKSHKPLELLPFVGETFEAQVLSVVAYFESLNFRLKSWTRVPYLCEGDLSQSVYVLDDALFLFSKNGENEISQNQEPKTFEDPKNVENDSVVVQVPPSRSDS